jgi:hypothetical protein
MATDAQLPPGWFENGATLLKTFVSAERAKVTHLLLDLLPLQAAGAGWGVEVPGHQGCS